MAQEILMTFATHVGEVALIPSTGGAFEIRLDGEILHSRLQTHVFPESKHIKRMLRDRIAPTMTLGHGEREDTNTQT
jgi:selenoprotein W-related protein